MNSNHMLMRLVRGIGWLATAAFCLMLVGLFLMYAIPVVTHWESLATIGVVAVVVFLVWCMDKAAEGVRE